MTERKVLNKYYPIDFDPSKIPKLKGKQKEANRLWGIRVMAPFNMRCNTCGEYIYKGKKFNSKKETVDNEDYLGIQIHRFYIRCPKCVAVIAFKTDPEHCDYTLEAGATRNFEAAKTLQDMEKKKQKELEDEEAANPMKVLENRTKQSKNEMDTMEALTELRELNARHEKVDHESMIKKAQLVQQELVRLQKAEEDRLIQELFGKTEEPATGEYIRRIEDDEEGDDDWTLPPSKMIKTSKPTDLLTVDNSSIDSGGDDKSGHASSASTSNNSKPAATSLTHKKPSSTKALLSGLVRVKKSSEVNPKPSASSTSETSAITSTGSSVHSSDSNGNGKTEQKATGALSMLGGYSSSSGDDSE